MAHRAPHRRPNQGGVHHLRSAPVLRALVRSAAVGPEDHVLDLGAGPGPLTAHLARTGARVTAVERDPAYVAELRRRFGATQRVHVVLGDLRTVRLPDAAKVVANIPFAASGALLERLLGEPVPRPAIDLVVQHGFARRVAGAPRSADSAWWHARYELRVLTRVRREAFGPPPAVDAAHLRIRARPPLPGEEARRLRALLRAVHSSPGAEARTVARRVLGPKRGGRAVGGVPASPPERRPPPSRPSGGGRWSRGSAGERGAERRTRAEARGGH